MPKRILIVDDTPEDRLAIKRLLRRIESDTICLEEATSVADGINLLEGAAFDCLLLDHHLPDGRGVDVLDELRRRGVQVAAVYLTNAGVEEAAVTALRAGAQDFVSKDGLSVQTLWRAIENAIERVGMARELAESEAKYRALSQDLEERVSARTEALTKALDELSGFTYAISHDLRAPIRAIVSSSKILIEEYGDTLATEVVEQLDRQAAAGVKLGRLVDDLLEYARLGGGQMKRKAVDLTVLAQDVAKSLSQHGWNGEGATFRIEDGLKATADASMVEILLTILFDNAGKYRKPGVAPTIQFYRDGETFCVKDDGIGFDMRYVHKLFRAFERLHRDQAYVGTGIGLANARRIVERHGGEIWADSSPDEGARFCFTLAKG